MATINKLVSATPAKQGRKNGYALEWDDSPNSPTWLPTAQFDTLRSNLGEAYQDIIASALETGQPTVEDAETDNQSDDN